MSNVTVPYPEAGLASFEQLDTYLANFVLLAANPPLLTFPKKVKASTSLAQFTVCGFDNNGDLVKAVLGTVEASVIVTQAVTAGASPAVTVPVFYSGNFNQDALVWDATYDTDAKKQAAFVAAAQPVQIVIGKRPS